MNTIAVSVYCFGLYFYSVIHTSSILSILNMIQPDVALLISAPSLRVHYCLSLTLSVCMSVCLSVCHKHCFFFIVSRWNRAISWLSLFHDKNYKTLFFDF